jgi:hypothetical protein
MIIHSVTTGSHIGFYSVGFGTIKMKRRENNV